MEELILRQLEEEIAEKIKGYRVGTGVYDVVHVDRWIRQFPEEERLIVLTETNHLLEQNYVDEQRLADWARYVETNEEIMGADPKNTISKGQFLNIQTKGNSQKRLLEMLREHFAENGYPEMNSCAPEEAETYFYLDDCLYTGLTLLKDVDHWLATENPRPGSILKAVYIAGYNGAFPYVKKKLEEKCAPRNIKPELYLMKEYKNDVHQPQPYDVIWPLKITGDPYVDQYMEHLEEVKAETGRSGIGFRKAYFAKETGKESEQFTSGYNRYVFEQALMKKGAYICSLSENGNENMKPMGYKNDISLGFGAFFATEYNISNNCPLAFWWGSVEKTGTVLDQWYPLLPREANASVMPIEYIQDAEEVPEDLYWKLKDVSYSSFSFEQRQWSAEPLIKYGVWNFVGVVRVEDKVFLCLPKSVSMKNEESQTEKEKRLLKYAQLLERYFQKVKECAESVKFIPANPYWIDNLLSWCETRTTPRKNEQRDVEVLAAVKFEKVYEWLVAWLYRNQIRLSENDVFFDSQILFVKDNNINDPMYQFYHWERVNKRKEDRTLEDRTVVFEDQEKKNIPDIVIDFSKENQCCILDAKYSGWNGNGYKLPGNADIYKQFFYQEHLKRVYEVFYQMDSDLKCEYGEEEEYGPSREAEVYNFLVLPDYIGDTGDGLTRFCATIKFYYHEDREIGVIQINLEKLIDTFLKGEEEEQERQRKYLKMFCNNIKAL